MPSERYNRQIILGGFGENAQHRLSQARVLIIGAGGLGCPALQYLTAAGVGFIGIVDDDRVALSNLHRQILYSAEDIGRLKSHAATERLSQMNPEIIITEHRIRLDRNNILDILKNYDFILDGTDNFESRYLINDACALLQKPLVFAAVSEYQGQLAIFNVNDRENHSTNYRDLFPIPPDPDEIPNCAENGVLGVLPGIIGSMAAAEVIKLICGIGKPLINKILHYNLLDNQQYQMNIGSANNYYLPETEQAFLKMKDASSRTLENDFGEIDIWEMQAILKEQSTMAIDVRERHEIPVIDQNTYTQVPMSEFNSFLMTDISCEHIILLCQHGKRSRSAAQILHQRYGNTKKIYSLKGGIMAWLNYF